MKNLAKYSDWAPVVLRVALGIIFIAHGWQKLGNIEGTVGFFGTLGLAPFFAYLVSAVEFFGGILVLLGVFTRYASALLAVIMVVALALVKAQKGLIGAAELDVALLAGTLALVLLGAGKASLEQQIFKKEW